MNLVDVILFYFCLAVTGAEFSSGFFSQLRHKPRHKNEIELLSSRRDVNPANSPIFPIYQQGLNLGINSGHKVMAPILRSKRLYRHPASRTKNNVGIKSIGYIAPTKILKRTHTLPKRYHHAAEPDVDPHIPRMGVLHPGHTLLMPKGKTLKSASNYPKDNTDHLVYGNPSNFPITYNKTRSRVQYSDFRRTNDEYDAVENTVLQAILRLKDYQEQAGQSSNGVIVIGIEPPNKIKISREENSNEAAEILDLRRSKSRHEKIDRAGKYGADSKSELSGSSDSDSGDFDKNPGNPYTVHKNRYHQNWLWNHFMDGDHMNIDPYGPKVGEIGPSGYDLFFGRKWWYFNQDDYKPMR